MISVQNHQRLLSGSKFSLFIFVIILLVSCGGSKKSTSSSRSKKSPSSKRTEVTKVKNKSKEKVKEIEWTEGTDEKRPPIKNPPKRKADKGEILKEDVYDVTYFLPLDASSYTGGSRASSERFIHYYAGMEVAASILEKEGVNIRLNVVDEEKRKIDLLLESEVSTDTDVIVGPYDRDDLRKAAEFAKNNQITIVSPWQASRTITKENPYYVQLRPNLDEHYYAIFEDIKSNYDRSDVYVVGRNTNTKDLKRLKGLQKIASDIWGVKEKEVVNEYLLIQDSIDYGVTAYDSIFVEHEKTVVVVPNWSFKDEGFIYGALRRLSVEKGMSEVIVYGMPIMIESDKINFDYYSTLNMRVARSKFVDEGHDDVWRFKRDFLTKYGALPTDDAYEGYDNLMYIGRNLYKNGKEFQYFLEDDTGYYLQAAYKVTPTRENSTDDRFDKINYFENKNVDIIEFKNNRFTRASN